MPRDINGNYTLPLPPVIPHTTIESVFENSTDGDIAAALTDSLSRTGSGGMLVPFKNADGVQANPGITWANEPTSGWYRAATGDFWYAIGNANIFRISAAGIELAPGKTVLNISSYIRVQDAEPTVPPMKQGEEWWESDTGGFYMRYQNPDLTFTWVALTAAGGDFVPMGMRGAANGVASLDGTGIVPVAQLPPVAPLPPGTLVPTGTVLDFAGAAAPAGYLACDGASYTTAAQPALFAAIGYTWGGAGANFNVPSLARRATVGSGGVGTGTLGNAVGNVGGAETHLLTVPEIPAHAHGVTDPQHSHVNSQEFFPAGGAQLPGAGGGRQPTAGLSTNPAATGITIQNAGGGGAHNNIQPSAVMLKIIKT